MIPRQKTGAFCQNSPSIRTRTSLRFTKADSQRCIRGLQKVFWFQIFDENINFKKSIIYDYGFNYALDTKISFRTYISNSFGGTPSTSILTIPSSNEPILGTRIIYTPSGYESSLEKKNSSAKFQSGLSVSTTNLLGTNVNYYDISYDSFGSYWTTYRIGLSKTFDFEAVSGSASNNVDQKNKYVKDYLNDTDTIKNV